MKKLCIMLHGYGSNKQDLEGLIPELKVKSDVKFVALNAPEVCEEGNGGKQWYSLRHFDREDLTPQEKLKLVESEIYKGLNYVKDSINKELKKENLEWKDLIILGFSQGGGMALQMSLISEKNNAPNKCIALSPINIFDKMYENQNTNVLICSGIEDPLISSSDICETVNILVKNKVQTKLNLIKNMAHEINKEVIQEIISFIDN